MTETVPEYFDDLPDLDPRIRDGIEDMGFKTMTPIQSKAIPPMLLGHDLIGMAQTGTGKTAAFLVPIFQLLLNRERGKSRALILAPSRELALQIDEQMTGLAYHTGLTSAFIVGGMEFGPQERGIRGGSDVLIATPGRLLDHMKYDYVDLSTIEIAVLDEADRMMDMGFLPDVKRILQKLKHGRQMVLFSATMPPEIRKLTKEFLYKPVEIKIGRQQPVAMVKQSVYEVDPRNKERLLVDLLKTQEIDSAIVFLRTKLGVIRLGRKLQRAGILCETMHSDRTQSERVEALEAFRRRDVRYLIATDIAARGLDISNISHVINFDISQNPDDYIHRVGRTARAQATGEALTFVTPDDQEALRRIEETIGRTIDRADTSHFRGAAEHTRRSGRRRR